MKSAGLAATAIQGVAAATSYRTLDPDYGPQRRWTHSESRSTSHLLLSAQISLPQLALALDSLCLSLVARTRHCGDDDDADDEHTELM